jgi:hypothetical protein
MTWRLTTTVVLPGRFAPCARGFGLLKTSAGTARHALAGEVNSSPAGFNYFGVSGSLPTKKMTLNRWGIRRGKISQRNKSTHLEERTLSAPNQ